MTPLTRSRRTPRCRRTLALAAASMALLGAVAGAQGERDRRVATGARLFRSLLAADVELARKVDAEGRLQIVVFYVGDRRGAEEVAAGLRGGAEGEPLRGLPVHVVISDDPSLADFATTPPAGIFLVEAPPAGALERLVGFGIRHHVLVCSPFEGHVEKGVHAGLAVEAQVRPYVNLDTLAASGITLKPFFMKVTKVFSES